MSTQAAQAPAAQTATARPLAAQALAAESLPGLLGGASLVVVDVETTGWLADAASITEIGAVRLSAGAPMAEFSALVNPGTPIPANISALTGITDAMVSDAPAIGDVLPRFLEFARGSVVVAHNAPFDIGFLTAACDKCGITWPPCAVIDTAVLARLVLRPQEVPDHKLATLAGHFATQTGPCHRALADAKATAGVLAGLLARVVASQGPQSRYDGAAAGARAPGSRRRLWSPRLFSSRLMSRAFRRRPKPSPRSRK